MPTYDYVCAACGHRFEVIHGVHAEGPVTCPSCGGGPVRKGFSAPTIHFKGTGWAKKDRSATSRSSSSSTPSETAGAASSGGDHKAGSDADPATKTGASSSDAKPATAAGGAADKPSSGGGSSTPSTGGPAAAD